jgi:hypothetical protein
VKTAFVKKSTDGHLEDVQILDQNRMSGMMTARRSRPSLVATVDYNGKPDFARVNID